jgi:soluble lytic murein transglycosylase
MIIKMSYRTLLLVLFLNIGVSAPAVCAPTISIEADSSRQRTLFLAAEQALAEDDLETFYQLRRELADYPLYPYLTYELTKHKLRSQTPASIKTALAALQETPLKPQLLADWLSLLAEERLWHSYLSFSQPGGGISQQCHRLQALIETGKKKIAYTKVKPIWLSGHSQPKACDPVLEAWIEDGQLDETLTWQRIGMAMKEGQTRLAHYLKRYLGETESQWAERWLELYRHPAEVVHLPDTDHPYRDDMAVQAIQRLARRDIDAAYAAWNTLRSRMDFSDWQHLQVTRSLLGALSKQQTSLESRQITDLLPKQYLHLDSTLSDKQLQIALLNGDWKSVLLTLQGLPKKAQQEDRWRYWQARALISLNQTAQGELILKELSGIRSYYGFLAAQQLGANPNLTHEKLQADPVLTETLAQLPGLQRARELHLLDRPLDARREWNLALKEKSEAELRAATRLAEKWNWPSQGIITLARLHLWDDLELRFPLTHLEAISSQALGHGIDTAWIYAILRQESAFMTDAKSSVGARGLMQLMPKTAEAVANELNQPTPNPDELFLPEVNIKLGAGYLNKIFRQLQENPVLATAAYNAGPMRVESWLPEKQQAADIWIETVPFKETREYLKRVLAYTVIYNYRLGQDPVHLPTPWLPPIEGHPAVHPEHGGETSISGV